MAQFLEPNNLPYSMGKKSQVWLVNDANVPWYNYAFINYRMSTSWKSRYPLKELVYYHLTPNIYVYILTIIDDYSRFPFAFSTKRINSITVMECLHRLFSMFDIPAYVLSDRAQSFLSQDVQQYLTGSRIATSRTIPYNPTGNGQVENM